MGKVEEKKKGSALFAGIGGTDNTDKAADEEDDNKKKKKDKKKQKEEENKGELLTNMDQQEKNVNSANLTTGSHNLVDLLEFDTNPVSIPTSQSTTQATTGGINVLEDIFGESPKQPV